MQSLTTESKLDKRQALILECLLARTPDESLGDVATRAGVHKTTIFRLMRDPVFYSEYRQALTDELSAARGQARHVIEELSRIAFSDIRKLFGEDGNLLPTKKLPSSISAAISSVEVSQRKTADGDIEYVKKVRLWSKTDALKLLAKYFDLIHDTVEVTGPGGGPIEINSNVSVDSLPLYIRQLLVLVSNGKELDSELQSMLQAKLGPMFAEFLAERREQIANGTVAGAGNNLAIEASYRVESEERETKPRQGRKLASLPTDDLESI